MKKTYWWYLKSKKVMISKKTGDVIVDGTVGLSHEKREERGSILHLTIARTHKPFGQVRAQVRLNTLYKSQSK